MQHGFIGQVLKGLMNGGTIEVDGPDGMERDFTFVSDVVEANLRCLQFRTPGYSVFNIGSGRSYTVSELIEVAEIVLRKKANVRYRKTPDGSVYKTAADISAARSRLGYQPRVTLAAGLQRTFGWAQTSDLPWRPVTSDIGSIDGVAC